MYRFPSVRHLLITIIANVLIVLEVSAYVSSSFMRVQLGFVEETSAFFRVVDVIIWCVDFCKEVYILVYWFVMGGVVLLS